VTRALVLVLLCGCAAGHRPAPAASPVEPAGALAQARAHTEELARAEATLGPGAADAAATPAAAATDCPGARTLVHRICELADHICALGEKATTDEDKAEIARLCADGKARCTRARARTEERCATAGPLR